MLYLLKRKGLDCIYNCEDASTPDPADVYISCEDLWITGGPTTGLNDPNVNTLIPAVGTTSDIAMFTTGSLTPGDIIVDIFGSFLVQDKMVHQHQLV